MAEACPLRWFALTVKPQHEKTVVDQLTSKLLEAYAPFYRSRRRWSDRLKTVELPLFPRYVFCRFSFEERLRVMNTFSVTSIVGFAGKPMPVDDHEIDAVRAMVGSGLPVGPWPLLRLGQRIRIEQGPLAGLEGFLVREKSLYRIVVNVELLNRAVSVEIERDLVRALSGSPPAPVSELVLRP